MARAKAQPAEIEVQVEETASVEEQSSPPATVAEEQPNEPVLASPEDQEFNEFIKQLVENFVEQKVAGLEERIRDLETLLGSISMSGPGVDEPVPFVPTTTAVPEYRPASQSSGGTPWYQG